MEMVAIVPFPVHGRILQPEIRRKIDDPFGQTFQGSETAHRLRMRKGDKKEIDLFQIGNRGEKEGGSLPEIGMDSGHRLSRVPFRSDLMDLHLRMIQKEAQELAPTVARCAHDRDPHLRATSKT
jgi:hypothetical protein